MRKLLFGAVIVGVLSGGAFWALTAPRPMDAASLATLAGDATQGEAVFHAAGCASCHIAPERDADPLVLSGGREFASDFGTFIAPNISPDPEYGIGAWSAGQFVNAVMRGISPEGAHYYPAFPYTSYIRADPQDIADLYAFMMTLPADATPSQPHDLGFPFNIRRGVGLWKALFLREGWVVTGDLSEEEARGRYLSEALSHCAECHSPRNALGALDHGRWLLGAPNPSGTGRIPAIAGDGFDWTAFDISAYLESGLTPDFDVVGGSMAAVVRSLQHLEKSELDAIAAYILRAGR
ncbi:mono/diheme cytochrome c family protein [Roseinatronobacter thiooxidans]|uniref:Mono/diheme cytochrome c family protein n=1 Tax=Roseinatronobacter thiooxidans TaxID=121821 RepID=A0A2W7R7U1_9RHOB|nr:cytochrome c [Roseinatronobacter thiooxidans]PZX46655.1 mono/diheme cytochrome c family protein [Roseinatronobacter thiooxidans]